jgi:hypothetical protein
MARRNKERATDRLHQALMRVSASVELIDKMDDAALGANAAVALRTQLHEGIDEAYAALDDIRHLAATL